MASQRLKRDRSAADFLPPVKTLPALKKAAASCEGCNIYKRATQTVFGEGPKEATVVFVGEQPGDYEDRAGRPFVGPAGRMFDKALAEARLERGKVYVTNAVKHFKWKPMGKRRKHERPLASEIAACFPWLEAEVEVIRPQILVCLGATAARVIFGDSFRITRDRGRFAPTRWAPKTIATYHPSAVLRGQDDAEQARLYAMLVEDLRKVAGA